MTAVIHQMMIEEENSEYKITRVTRRAECTRTEEVFLIGVHNLLCNYAADDLEMHVKFTGSTGRVIMLPTYDVLKCFLVSIGSSLGFGHNKKLSNAQLSALMLYKIISWLLTVSVMHCTKTKENPGLVPTKGRQ